MNVTVQKMCNFCRALSGAAWRTARRSESTCSRWPGTSTCSRQSPSQDEAVKPVASKRCRAHRTSTLPSPASRWCLKPQAPRSRNRRPSRRACSPAWTPPVRHSADSEPPSPTPHSPCKKSPRETNPLFIATASTSTFSRDKTTGARVFCNAKIDETSFMLAIVA